jgi:flagellar FliL protein
VQPEFEDGAVIEAKPSRFGRMVRVVLLSLIAGSAGGTLSFALLSKMAVSTHAGAAPGSDAAQDDIVKALENGAVVPLEPFVVNLADRESARYLRIQIGLMVDDKNKINEVRGNQALQLKIRDVILQTLTGKTSQQLIGEDGKNQLRREIQQKVDVFFREPKLVDVMFTDFVIQL